MIFSINTLMFAITATHHFCVTCLSEKVIHIVHSIFKSPWTLLSSWKEIDFSFRSSKVLEIQPLGLPLTTFGINDMIMQKRICSWTYKDFVQKEVVKTLVYWKIKVLNFYSNFILLKSLNFVSRKLYQPRIQ